MSVILPVGANSILAPGFPQARLPANFAVPDGLVGYWGFDEDCLDFTNNLALDLSGNGNHGTLNNLTSSMLGNGKVGAALSFNGTNSRITKSSNTSLSSTSAIAVAAWVNGASQSNKSIVSKYLTTGNQRSWYINAADAANGFGTNKIDVFISLNGTLATYKEYVSSVVAFDSTWHFIAFTFASGILTLYVDGVADTGVHKITDSVVGSIFASTAQVNIGAIDNPLNFYSGSIDDVRIYNRALAPWEVIQLYQAGLAGRRDAGQQIPQWSEIGMM